MKAIITVVGMLVAVINCFGQPVISTPTNSQVYYNGETMTIKWQSRPGAWQNVSIMLQDSHYGTVEWIAFNTPNDGEYNWTVGKYSSSTTNHTITICDGGSGANCSVIAIQIPNGTRPKPPEQVASVIRKVVSVEWIADTNHTYQVLGSTDLKSWNIVAEGQSPTTNAVALFYVDQDAKFFKVLDVTP